MRKLILTIVGGLAVSASPAVSAQDAAAPPPTAPTTIVYSNDGMSRMSDLPMGIHRIPDSNVVISGHQKGGALGLLFGPVGMVVQSSANAGDGTAKVQSMEDDLRIDAITKAGELTQAILADGNYQQAFQLGSTPGGRTLNVVPYVVITFQNETDVRPYIVLKTKLATGAPNESPKALKYFCCEGKAFPLLGENGLAANGGARLKELLTAELETAIQVMLLDRSTPYIRDKSARVNTNGFLPFVGKPLKMRGYDLGRYKDYSLIDYQTGILVFGGVNIVEPGALEITPVPPK